MKIKEGKILLVNHEHVSGNTEAIVGKFMKKTSKWLIKEGSFELFLTEAEIKRDYLEKPDENE